MLAVNWTAVGALASVAAVLASALIAFGPSSWRRWKQNERRVAADEYLTRLKAAAKAIDDAAAERIEMTAAQSELTKLSGPEERLRRAFGDESAVHWIARLNGAMLRRAFDIARAGSSSASDVTLHNLVTLGIDHDGFTTFEIERSAAMKQRREVRTFASHPQELRNMADLARMSSPYGERFDEILKALGY